MASKTLLTMGVCSFAFAVAACSGDDSEPAGGTEGTSTGEPAASSSGEPSGDTTGTVCDESMSDFEPGTLPADVVISVGSSLLTPHPTLQAAFVDVQQDFLDNDVRVALIANSEYDTFYEGEACPGCMGAECMEPVEVALDPGVIEPVARLEGSVGGYSCVFRPPGESVRHFVAMTDTDPGGAERETLISFLESQAGQADIAFHVAFMDGCSQMEGGMGLVDIATMTGGTSGNICDGVAGVREFLQGVAPPRVACGWPVPDPGANNSSDNLELVLLDGPSGGEMEMTRVADGLCTPGDGDNPPFEWFISLIDGVENVRLCPATCGALQANWEPGEVSFRQMFTCPA